MSTRKMCNWKVLLSDVCGAFATWTRNASRQSNVFPGLDTINSICSQSLRRASVHTFTEKHSVSRSRKLMLLVQQGSVHASSRDYMRLYCRSAPGQVVECLVQFGHEPRERGLASCVVGQETHSHRDGGGRRWRMQNIITRKVKRVRRTRSGTERWMKETFCARVRRFGWRGLQWRDVLEHCRRPVRLLHSQQCHQFWRVP